MVLGAAMTGHRCHGCGHRWDAEHCTGALCGDCWRKAQHLFIPEQIQLVEQEDYAGCLVACLAMVTRQTYQQVKRWDGFTGKNFREKHGGLSHLDVEQYLADHGFASALRFRWFPGCAHDGHHTRDPWPTAAFAPVHILGVRNSGQHGIVLLGDGQTVLDPLFRAPQRLSDYSDVGYMLGVFKVAA